MSQLYARACLLRRGPSALSSAVVPCRTYRTVGSWQFRAPPSLHQQHATPVFARAGRGVLPSPVPFSTVFRFSRHPRSWRSPLRMTSVCDPLFRKQRVFSSESLAISSVDLEEPEAVPVDDAKRQAMREISYIIALCEAGQAEKAEELTMELTKSMSGDRAHKLRRVSVPLAQSYLKRGEFDKAMNIYRWYRELGRPTPSLLTTMMDAAARSNQHDALQELLEDQRTIPIHAYRMKLSQSKGSEMMGFLSRSAEKRLNVDPIVAIKHPRDKIAATHGVTESEFDKQMRLEARVVDQAVAEYQRLRECVTQLGKGAAFRPAQLVLLEWYEPLWRRIKVELQAVDMQMEDMLKGGDGIAKPHRLKTIRNMKKNAKKRKKKKKGDPDEVAYFEVHKDMDDAELRLLKSAREIYGPLISGLSPEKLAIITIHEVLGMVLLQPTGIKFVTLAMQVGKAVHSEMQYQKLQAKKLLRGVKHPSIRDVTLKYKLHVAADEEDAEWSAEEIVAVGSCLLGALVETAQICVSARDVDGGGSAAGSHVPTRTTRLAELLASSGHGKVDMESSRAVLEKMAKDEKQEEALAGVTPDRTIFSVSEVLDNYFQLEGQAVQEQRGDVDRISWDDYTSGQFQTSQFQAIAPRPAFVHSYQRDPRGMRVGMISCNPAVLSVVESGHLIRESLFAAHLPMVIPPLPWERPQRGCYLQVPVSVMRWRGGLQKELVKATNLNRVYNGLDLLGNVPWQVNKFVYSVIREAWEQGGGFAELPTRADVAYPTPPLDFSSSGKSRKVWRMQKQRVKKRNEELHSLRCSLLLKLQVAEEFLNEERVFFPHNLDFRGRCYPIPPHLNHMGSDLSRGLLQFAKGKPLGETGVDELKLHIANLCGENKISFDDRIAFTERHMDDIRDSVSNPLDGNRWWAQQEDPWQVLAASYDLVSALDSGDPARYVSCLPVHKDGSCNGLQHYAALGGDLDGARSVNLLAAEEPQDVYSHVLRFVQQALEHDAAEGNELAQKLKDVVVRKTIKQTVMTSVYGVTFIGAKAQIQSQLKDVEMFSHSDAELNEASMYVARLTFDSMKKMFTAAREIMAWLSECARLTGVAGHPISWRTPLGLVIVQPYRRPGKKLVKTLLQTVVLEDESDNLPVNVRKQQTAFPPNYVHSLDSTHMFFTAERCAQHGITFAAVHDSYWTHACDISRMSQELRHAFVDLHGEDLLQTLLEQLRAQHPDVEYPAVPVRGPLNVRDVIDSPYFFH